MAALQQAFFALYDAGTPTGKLIGHIGLRVETAKAIARGDVVILPSKTV
jgi:hypothetical protein